MRFLAALISASALLASLSAVRAESPADRMVQLLNDACISPTTPGGMIDAGHRFAAAEGWKLVDSGPTPLPIMHNENGPKISFQSGWEVGLPDGSQANLYISIVRPELPGVRHSICVIAPAVEIEPDVLGRALEQRLGSLIIKDRRTWNGSRNWFFTEESQHGNCGRQITLVERNTPSLMYVDGSYPNDGNWNGPLSQTMCRS